VGVGGAQARLFPTELRPALPSSGCSCDPRGTLGGVAECQLVSLRLRCQGCGTGRLEPPPRRPPSCPVPFSLLTQGNGQCFCKAHVCGQTCAACKDGFFGLDQADYFGCRSKCPLTDLQAWSLLSQVTVVAGAPGRDEWVR
jgi:hypothetical protein